MMLTNILQCEIILKRFFDNIVFQPRPAVQQTSNQTDPSGSSSFSISIILSFSINSNLTNLTRSIILVFRYGAFGVVWSVTDPRDGKRVALKKLPNVFQSLVSSKRVFRELKMMRFFKHENVLSCLDILQVKLQRSTTSKPIRPPPPWPYGPSLNSVRISANICGIFSIASHFCLMEFVFRQVDISLMRGRGKFWRNLGLAGVESVRRRNFVKLSLGCVWR